MAVWPVLDNDAGNRHRGQHQVSAMRMKFFPGARKDERDPVYIGRVRRFLSILLASCLAGSMSLLVWPSIANAETVFGHSVTIPGENAGKIFTDCVSTGNCIAVGIAGTAKFWSITETAGHLGSVTERALPPGTTEFYSTMQPTDSGVEDLSCSSLTHCAVVIGNAVHGVLRNTQLLIFTLSGTSWSNYSVFSNFHHVSNQGAIPSAEVRCWSSQSCTLMGDFHTSPDNTWTLFAATITGTTAGDAQTFPVSQYYTGDDQYEETMACVNGANWCEVAGQIDGITSGTGREVFVGTLSNGVPGTLTVLQPPSGFNAHNQWLTADTLTCASVNNCTLAGSWANAAGNVIHKMSASMVNGTWSADQKVS